MLGLAALAFFVAGEWYYWPHRWPRGPTSSWQWWDWVWVTVVLATAPFAIMWRIYRWASWIDLQKNIEIRKGGPKPKPDERDESEGFW